MTPTLIRKPEQDKVTILLLLPNRRFPLKLGTIKGDTFTTVRKTSKNIYYMEKGLGVNHELLTTSKFNFIVCPYNGRKLKTTREHFISKGKVSKHNSSKVDLQIILPVDDWCIPNEQSKVS